MSKRNLNSMLIAALFTIVKKLNNLAVYQLMNGLKKYSTYKNEILLSHIKEKNCNL
jgi:hypothetical protein